MPSSDSFNGTRVWHLVCGEEWRGLGIAVIAVAIVVVLLVADELLALAELGPVESRGGAGVNMSCVIIGFNICHLLLSSEKWHLNLLIYRCLRLLVIGCRFQAEKRGGISPEALRRLCCFEITVIRSRILASSRTCNLEMLRSIEAQRVESLRRGIISRCSGLVINGNFWFLL